ncbi:MAG: anthranilate synthase component I family protein [Leptospiraceae bacterium]|nr:anthranilate synthase component I family protein [Leptospiraceae bacterium]
MVFPQLKLEQKPTYLRLANDIDFIQLFRKIESSVSTCFLFESLEKNSFNSRYSIIGFDPEGLISAKNNSISYGKETFTVENPYWELRKMMPHPTYSRDYVGGFIGYLSYEAMNYFEKSLKLPTESKFPEFEFGIYKDGLVQDKMTGETFYFYYDKNRLDWINSHLESPERKRGNSTKIQFLGYSMSQEEHKNSVLNVLEKIRAGHTFQCQIGFKAEYEIKGDPLAIYEALRLINPSPHCYFIKFPNTTILGASPELLFRLHNGEIETYPLAGSIRRGSTDLEDTTLTRKLLNDPKEIAEHNMLVDLHRNDLGRIAKFGTVKVRKLKDVKRYSHIQHISSEVTAILNDGEDMFTGLASNFPAGTLSGAPKIESMKIIHENETRPRGIYGGGVGHFGFNGNCTFAIPIRSFFISGNYGYTQASGGVVFDSTPENEYDEIKRKLAAIQKSLEAFQ